MAAAILLSALPATCFSAAHIVGHTTCYVQSSKSIKLFATFSPSPSFLCKLVGNVPSSGMKRLAGTQTLQMGLQPFESQLNAARPGSRGYFNNIIAQSQIELAVVEVPTAQDVNKHLQYLSSSHQKSILRPQQNLMSRLIQVRRKQGQTSGKIEKSMPLETGMKAKSMYSLPQLGVMQKMGISFVNVLFNIPPVRASLARVARLVLADNAWRFGVDWKGTTAKWKSRFHELEEHLHIINTHPSYPTYYLKPFHAYEHGNLNWEAAFEVEAATLALTLRYWPNEVKTGTLLAPEAQNRVRRSILSEAKKYWDKGAAGRPGPQDICDVGCSVGISTEYVALAHSFTAKSITGIDLSPYYLAVAMSRAKDCDGRDRASRLFRDSKFIHSAAELTHEVMGEESTDLIYSQFVFHELPTEASRSVLKSLIRTLRPNGVIAITDVDVERMVKRSSPALIALFQITEPFFKEYAELDLEAELVAAGFKDVSLVQTDPKNRLVLARKT